MFVGHYAAAMAARSIKPAVPLWLLFVAVQFVDFLWAALVMLGIEKVKIIPGYTAASPLNLYHMPYTHSLVAAVGWSLALGLVYMVVRRGEGRLMAGLILGAAVFSHWLTDLLVHVPDLPLIYGDPKFGFGLWRYFWISQALEVGLLAAGTLLYVSFTRAKGAFGRFTPWLLLLGLVLVQAISHVPPAEVPTPTAFAAQALFAYSLLAFLAFLVDRTREAK